LVTSGFTMLGLAVLEAAVVVVLGVDDEAAEVFPVVWEEVDDTVLLGVGVVELGGLDDGGEEPPAQPVAKG